mmetsp:Transcript_74771/g.178447  ORF Transcript_74771/g.178447 Transcript_74771/m.178447 type:complete len:219 (-) Transcript_74771:621-1277(-)
MLARRVQATQVCLRHCTAVVHQQVASVDPLAGKPCWNSLLQAVDEVEIPEAESYHHRVVPRHAPIWEVGLIRDPLENLLDYLDVLVSRSSVTSPEGASDEEGRVVTGAIGHPVVLEVGRVGTNSHDVAHQGLVVVARAEVGVAGHVLQVLILQLCSVCQQVVGCRESSMDVVVRHLRAMYQHMLRIRMCLIRCYQGFLKQLSTFQSLWPGYSRCTVSS